MYAPYGFRESDILDKPIPGCWIRRDDGPPVIELARSGRGQARLLSTGTREPGITHNVVGEIPGRGSDELMVLSCHHDSPFTSPVEDGSGVAVVLALAQHFARAQKLRRRLVVLLSAGHFYGSIGTRTFIREHRAELLRRAAIEISIEHIAREAVEDGAGRLVATGLPEPTGVFVPHDPAVAKLVLESLRAFDVRRSVLLPSEGPLGDYPPTDGGDWYHAGIPVINCISNPVYLLTNDDALQWVDKPRMAAMARAFERILCELDSVPREQIAARGSLGRRLLLKAMRRVATAKTTAFGLKPVY